MTDHRDRTYEATLAQVAAEYRIDLSTPAGRALAATHVARRHPEIAAAPHSLRVQFARQHGELQRWLDARDRLIATPPDDPRQPRLRS